MKFYIWQWTVENDRKNNIVTVGRATQGGATVGSIIDGGTGGGPGPAGTLNATGGKDQGLAHGAAVHSEWHRDGGPGVA